MLKQLKILKDWFWILPVCFVIIQQIITFNKHADAFINLNEYKQRYSDKDFISEYQKRFPDVRAFFVTPAHLGYCSEPGQNKSTFYLHFVLTQYNLAPNIIVPDDKKDTILYNLYETFHLDQATNYHLKNGWHIVRDFNNGFILIAK